MTSDYSRAVSFQIAQVKIRESTYDADVGHDDIEVSRSGDACSWYSYTEPRLSDWLTRPGLPDNEKKELPGIVDRSLFV